MTEALALARTSVDELQAGSQRAGKDLEEGESTVLRVVERLEDEGDGAVVIRGDVELLAVDKRDATEVGHGREPVHHGVHEGGDALLPHAGAREHGEEDALRHGLAQKALQLLGGDLLALEVLHHDLVVGLRDKVHQLVVRRLRGVHELRRHVFLDDLAVLEVAGLHADDVDDAGEAGAHAHGNGHGADAAAEALPQALEREVEVGVVLVETVDEQGARHGELLGREPEARGRGLGTSGIHHEDDGLARAHGRVCVTDEVGIAGGIEDVDARVTPGHGRDRGGDGEAARTLLGIVVKRGLGAGVTTQPGGLAREVQHRLGQHGLAHATLAHEDDVLYLLCFACHVMPP